MTVIEEMQQIREMRGLAPLHKARAVFPLLLIRRDLDIFVEGKLTSPSGMSPSQAAQQFFFFFKFFFQAHLRGEPNGLCPTVANLGPLGSQVGLSSQLRAQSELELIAEPGSQTCSSGSARFKYYFGRSKARRSSRALLEKFTQLVLACLQSLLESLRYIMIFTFVCACQRENEFWAQINYIYTCN